MFVSRVNLRALPLDHEREIFIGGYLLSIHSKTKRDVVFVKAPSGISRIFGLPEAKRFSYARQIAVMTVHRRKNRFVPGNGNVKRGSAGLFRLCPSSRPFLARCPVPRSDSTVTSRRSQDLGKMIRAYIKRTRYSHRIQPIRCDALHHRPSIIYVLSPLHRVFPTFFQIFFLVRCVVMRKKICTQKRKKNIAIKSIVYHEAIGVFERLSDKLMISLQFVETLKNI